MFRRVPLQEAEDLDDLEALLDADTADRIVMIFDADNTLVPQGVAVDVFRTGVTAAIERFEAHPIVSRVIVLTNGPARGVPAMIHRGNKPWTTRRRLGLNSTRDHVWVVGDQILTDGVLAWRLSATFVHLAIDVIDEAHRQATMRRVGRWISQWLFRS